MQRHRNDLLCIQSRKRSCWRQLYPSPTYALAAAMGILGLAAAKLLLQIPMSGNQIWEEEYCHRLCPFLDPACPFPDSFLPLPHWWKLTCSVRDSTRICQWQANAVLRTSTRFTWTVATCFPLCLQQYKCSFSSTRIVPSVYFFHWCCTKVIFSMLNPSLK